jgi:hypothetical protein
MKAMVQFPRRSALKNNAFIKGGLLESTKALISCQDVALPKGYDTEDKLILLIRSVYDGFKFCRDVRFSKIMSAG